MAVRNGFLSGALTGKNKELRERINKLYRQTSLTLKPLSLSARYLLCCNERRSANVAVKDFPSCVPAHVQQMVSRQVVVRIGTFVADPTGRLPVDGRSCGDCRQIATSPDPVIR